MNDIFEKSFMFVLKWEGGYVNDPNDPGGETKYGISKKSYPNLDIKNLTIDDAKRIYYKDYWIKSRCDMIEKSSPKLAFAHFNFSVNMGFARSSKLLQKGLSRQFDNIIIDGIIGNQTLNLISQSNAEFLYDSYFNYVTEYYVILVDKVKRLKIYLNGWLNRVISTYHYGLENFIEEK